MERQALNPTEEIAEDQAMAVSARDQLINRFQKRVANPLMRAVPTMTLLETTGRTTGQLRRTPVGGRRVGNQFWMVSEFGDRSQYVRNIQADPRVRVRLRGRWYAGTAHLLPEDDARARLRSLPRLNSAAVTALGSNLLTIRVDLDE
jgi:deazaflavin-dependent oxidoreductase (nitroreductase family)